MKTNNNMNIGASQQQNYTLETNMSVNNPSVLQPDNLERRLPQRSDQNLGGYNDNNYNQGNRNQTLPDDQYDYKPTSNFNQDRKYQSSTNVQSIVNQQQYQGSQQKAAPTRNDQAMNNFPGSQQKFDSRVQNPSSSALPLNNNNYNMDYTNQGKQSTYPVNLNLRPETNNVTKTIPSTRQEPLYSVNQNQKTMYVDQEPNITAIEADRPSYAPAPNQYYNTAPTNQKQQINRPPANPQMEQKYAQNINSNYSPNGKRKFPNKIFDNPMNNYRSTHRVAHTHPDEQYINGPGEFNKTMQLDENMTINDNVPMYEQDFQEINYQQNLLHNHNPKNVMSSAPTNYGIQSAMINANSRQNLAQTQYGGLAQTQYTRSNGQFPPIINAFMNNHLQLDLGTDDLFNRPPEQNIPIILVTLKTRVESKLDQCKDVMHIIQSETESIKKNCEEVHKQFLASERLCDQQELYTNGEKEVQLMHNAIQFMVEQQRYIESISTHVQKQLIQCEPEIIRKPIIQELELQEYVKETLRTLEDTKEPFTSNFDQGVLNSLNTKNFPQILSEMNKYSKVDRIIMLKTTAQNEKNSDLQYLHSFLKYLYDCDGMLTTISKEIESAVFKYAEFLQEILQKLGINFQYYNVYQQVLNQHITSYYEVHNYQNNYDLILQSSGNITIVLMNNIKFPFNENLNENERILKEIEFEKGGLMQSLVDYNLYIRNFLQVGVELQTRENVPYLIQTPFTRLVVLQSNEIDRYKKRLELFDTVMKAIRSLQNTTYQAQQYEAQAQDFMKNLQTRFPTETQLREKVDELHKIIIKLIDMRDNLGLHVLGQSHPYLYKDLMEEHLMITRVIDNLQDYQNEIARRITSAQNNNGGGDQQIQNAGSISQKQVHHMNSAIQSGNVRALPILQDQEDRIKRSRFSPKKYHDDLDRFNYEVTKTRHLLQQNAQRQMHF